MVGLLLGFLALALKFNRGREGQTLPLEALRSAR
jgi:hypothetical protein